MASEDCSTRNTQLDSLTAARELQTDRSNKKLLYKNHIDAGTLLLTRQIDSKITYMRTQSRATSLG